MPEPAQPDRIRPAAEPYAGRRIALLTRHGKERAIAPVLESALGCRVERVAGYDTDLLGTFTRDIPRAHANPTRMETIAEAAQDLAHKLCSRCPACGAPGFQLAERVPGLPCEDCGAPTRQASAEIQRCAKCAHQETVARPEAAAPPERCDYCNP